jgi:hypothetical protein
MYDPKPPYSPIPPPTRSKGQKVSRVKSRRFPSKFMQNWASISNLVKKYCDSSI